MGQLKWYKRDPRAALAGMMELSLEERGAYNTILDLIYAHDGRLEDRSDVICAWLRVDQRVWKRIRARLLDLEKLYLKDGHLHNRRADRTALEALSLVASLTEASNKRWAMYRKLNGLDHPNGVITKTTKILSLEARRLMGPKK